MRGRKPEAKGNVHKLASAAAMTPPEPPEHMTEDGVKKWRELAPELTRRGYLGTGMERDGFMLYCEAYSEWMHAQRTIADQGRIYTVEGRNGRLEKKKQAVTQRDEAIGLMIRIGAGFGITPRDAAAIGNDMQGSLLDILEDKLSGKK